MHGILKDMFVLGLPLLEKILRPVVVYAFLVISLRLSGKRELVQLNPFDLVVLLTLSNTVPVSYTHLDVYKRQMHWRTSLSDSKPCLRAAASSCATVILSLIHI